MAFVIGVIYCVYILIDTQLILGGKNKELTLDNYVMGAMILYVDIIGLFLKILQLLGEKKNKKWSHILHWIIINYISLQSIKSWLNQNGLSSEYWMYNIPSSPLYFWCISFTFEWLFTMLLPTIKNRELFWSSFSTFLCRWPYTSAMLVLSYIIRVMKRWRRFVFGYGSILKMIGTCKTQLESFFSTYFSLWPSSGYIYFKYLFSNTFFVSSENFMTKIMFIK